MIPLRINLEPEEIPTHWYNVAADLVNPPAPPLGQDGNPVSPEQMGAIFPMPILEQEMSAELWIAIPEEVRQIYALWRPAPLCRALRLEQMLGTPAKIFYKYEGVSPAGSHKPNSAVPQAYFNKLAGTKELTTETGAGQWGCSIALAGAPPRTPMQEELRAAAAVCGRARGKVRSMFKEARLGHAVDAQDCLPLVDEIAEAVMRHPGALVSLARLKTADEYSYMHSVAVCALMVALGRQLGLDDGQCRSAGPAGLMHDLGKAAIPLEILNKPGRLSEAEFAIVKEHPQRGHEMLDEGRGAGPELLDVSLHHHERMDVKGYPHGLAGEAISLAARMGAICDVYDAVTSNRPYKAGWDPAESIARMASWKGHFDSTLFAAFVRSLGIYPTGSLVRLESGRLAVVVEQNPNVLTAPVVKVFFSTRSNLPIPAQHLDLAVNTTDRIVGRESPTQWGFTFLDELWADPELLRQRRA